MSEREALFLAQLRTAENRLKEHISLSEEFRNRIDMLEDENAVLRVFFSKKSDFVDP